jgi:hypothetical protein
LHLQHGHTTWFESAIMWRSNVVCSVGQFSFFLWEPLILVLPNIWENRPSSVKENYF